MELRASIGKGGNLSVYMPAQKLAIVGFSPNLFY